ncbi:MAG: flavoprotein [Phycisphaerae bacterium]|nr:MAG: flavoprotein [Phycisphaerae bacterium]
MDGNSNELLTSPSMPEVADIVIVGGGAAGLATAIFCARQNRSRSIVILDGVKKLGAKILVSGGGRCNVTNRSVTIEDFWGGKRNIIKRVLNALPVDKTISFFESIDVGLREEEGNGKLFPVSDKAQTVLDALVGEARRLNIQMLCNHRVIEVVYEGTRFKVTTNTGIILGDNLVLATGGQSLPKTGSDGFGFELAAKLGHELVARTPALDPLILEGDVHRHLSGISHSAVISVKTTNAKPVRVKGELLWTHFGLSGPVALDASRHWHRAEVEGVGSSVSVGFLPDHDLPSLESWLLEFTSKHPKTHLVTAVGRLLPNRIAHSILDILSVDHNIQMAQLSKVVRRKVVAALLDWPIAVTGGRGYKFAEATAGGVSLSEVNPSTLESRKCPNLYFVGEILDVDGRIGGFNFQWAWSSAWVAGTALAAAKLSP